MKLGFVTACLPAWDLGRLGDFAKNNGYSALEVAAWPALGNRPFTASHIDVDNVDVSTVDRLRSDGVEISSLAFMDNPLDPNPSVRADMHAHLHKVIDAAAAIGCPTVGAFVGRNPNLSIANSLKEAEEVFKPFVDHAGQNNIKIIIENCVMEGWFPDIGVGNLAYSPELWEWMFSLGLYLNFDPSHLTWIGVDPVVAVKPYVDRIPHAQAKDIQLFEDIRNKYGFFGRVMERPSDPWNMAWWRYRVPGLGQVDWTRLIDALYEGGFNGVLSVEHEDPVWGGTEDKIGVGLQIAERTLKPHLVR